MIEILLEVLYFSYDRPVLEYGNVLWDNITHNKKYELDKTRKKAARIVTVTVTTKQVSMQSLNKHTKWETLEERRRKVNLHSFIIWLMVSHLLTSRLLFHFRCKELQI